MIQRFPSAPILLDERVSGAADAPHATDAARPRPTVGRVALQRLRVAALIVLLCMLWMALLGWAAQAPMNAAFQPAARID